MAATVEKPWGLLAEFSDANALIHAAEETRKAGYSSYDTFAPIPIEPLMEAQGLHRNELPWLVFFCGAAGLCAGFGLAYWSSVIEYPINVGGRPFNSWQAFIPPTFETTVLFAAFGAVFGMLGLNGLPRPYHPLFNVEAFERATQDGFFLAIESEDAKFEAGTTRAFLEGLGATEISEVQP